MQINIPPFAIGIIRFQYEYHRSTYPERSFYEAYETKVELKYFGEMMKMKFRFDHPQIEGSTLVKLRFSEDIDESYPHFYDYTIFKTAAKEFIIEGCIVLPIIYSDFYHVWHFVARIKSSYMPKTIQFWDVTE